MQEQVSVVLPQNPKQVATPGMGIGRSALAGPARESRATTRLEILAMVVVVVVSSGRRLEIKK